MTTQPAGMELVELERAPSSLEDVTANALRNVLGGLSIGGIVFVCLSMTQLDWQTIAEWSLRATGLGVFAALIVFGLGDDLFNWWRRRQLANELAAAKEAMAWADGKLAEKDATIRILEYKNAEKDSVIAHYQKGRNFVEATPTWTDDTMEDARALVRDRFAHNAHPTRRAMNERGWSDDRYAAALSILKQRGVLRVTNGNRVEYADADSTSALKRLESA